LITGASKGIGRALSLRFAEEGAAVVCTARSADQVKATAAEVTRTGGRAIAVVADASLEDDVRRIVAIGASTFGKIDTLVNNAGDGGPTKPVQDYLMEDWRYTIDSCLTSSYLCTRFVVPEMLKTGSGAIVNISSGAGRRGLPLPHRLLRGEGRAGWHDIRDGARAGSPQYPRQLRGAGRRGRRSHRSGHRRPSRRA
jgi:3-oxoacyl-[acyl-carrier protein] reductase